MTAKYLLSLLSGLLVAAHASLVLAEPIRAEGSGAGYLFLSAVAKAAPSAKAAPGAVSAGLDDAPAALAKFCRGELEIVAVPRPIAKREAADCQARGQSFVEAAVALDAVVLVVNPRNRFLQSVTLEELRTLWQEGAEGEIIRWRQVNPDWPDTPIKLLGSTPGGAEASFFNEAVLGRGKPARGDYLASVDENILIQGLVRDPNAFGYLAYPYYSAHRTMLRAVAIADSQGTSVPTPDALSAGTYRPLARALFIYVRSKSLERPEVSAFAESLLTNGAAIAKGSGTVPLSEAAYRRGLERLKARQVGSAYGGEAPREVGPEQLN